MNRRRLWVSIGEIIGLLLDPDPRRGTASLLALIFAVGTFSWVIDANYEWLLNDLSRFGKVALSAILLVNALGILYLLARYARSRSIRRDRDSLSMSKPEPSQGLILFLSTLSVHHWKLSQPEKDLLGSPPAKGLLELIEAPSPDWATIQRLLQITNWQVPLKAIEHHQNPGSSGSGLDHIWIIVTEDTASPDSGPRPGSAHHLNAFRVAIENLLNFTGTVHDHEMDGRLLTNIFDVQRSFKAVDVVYSELAPRVDLLENQIVSDLTSGTAVMTAGMVLACGLANRRLQYMAGNDPISGAALDVPAPIGIHLDSSELIKMAIHGLSPDLAD